MFAVVLFLVSARAELAPTEAWLHLEVGERGPVRGRVRYALSVGEPTAELRLDCGKAVRIRAAALENARGGGGVPLGWTRGAGTTGALRIRLPAPIEPGAATLALEFTAPVSTRAPGGFLATFADSQRYLFTHFEPNHARDAFPSFDEPRFKHPWTVDVEAPVAFRVASNTAAATLVRAHETNKWGFTRTPPLPSYLVALAAGPFVAGSATEVGRARNTVDVLATSPAVLKSVLGQVGPAVKWAEDWMDAPLPWPKLDVVVAPVGGRFGAMENPGLVVLGSNSLGFWLHMVLRHELLHFWFGDRVSPSSWADIWLSEGPAYWGSTAPTAELAADIWQPGLGTGTPGPVHVTSFPSDTVVFTPRQQWGAGALFAMLDAWRSLVPSGFDSLQVVLRKCVAARIDGHSDTPSFLAHLAAAWPDLPVAEVLAGLLEEAGTPTVTVGWRCGGSEPGVSLTVVRGAASAPAGPLPVFFRVAGQETKVVLLRDSTLVPMEGCPAWVLGNATGAGFYRVTYSEAGLAALRQLGAADLSKREHLSLDVAP